MKSARSMVKRTTTAQLEQRAGRWRHVEQIHGVAAHDCCHTGQIQLIKRLATRAGKP